MLTKLSFCLLTVSLLVVAGMLSLAQELPSNITKEDLANNNKLFAELATKALHWG